MRHRHRRQCRARHLRRCEAALAARGQHAGTDVLAPGEATKSFAELARLCERLLEMGLERGDLVIALGGGVIGDLAGFAASILRRGMRFVQMPTTLLAQVDSSVGGKTGINTPQGKNLVGAFHQPRLVLADTDVLATLPRARDARRLRRGREIRPARRRRLLRLARAHWRRGLRAATAQRWRTPSRTACRAKAAIVARDETETGDRALLNLGHTFGHALEAGPAIPTACCTARPSPSAWCLAFRLPTSWACVGTTARQRVAAHLPAVGLPTRIADIPGGQAARRGRPRCRSWARTRRCATAR